MNKIFSIIITLLLFNISFSEIIYTPHKSVEVGGDIRFTIYNINNDVKPSSDMYIRPVLNYYFLNWLYLGPLLYYKRTKEHYSRNLDHEYMISNYYGTGINIGLMKDFGILVIPCLDVGCTLEFTNIILLPRYGSEKIEEKTFDGFSFPLSFIAKIPVSQNLQVNLRSTLLVRLTSYQNNDFVFSVGLTGNILNGQN